jgi:class 3 adenylate cyclase
LQSEELVDINLDTKIQRQRLKRRLMRVIIPVGCVLFMVATILSISAYGYYVNRRDTLALSENLLESLDRRIATQVHDYLAPASEMVQLVAEILEEPTFGIDKRSELEALIFQILRAYPQLTTFSAGTPEGEFLMVKKMPDGGIDTKNIEISEAGRRVYWIRRDRENKIVGEEESKDDPYDPRVRPWYEGAVKDKRLYWTDIYIFFTDQSPGVTASMPVYDQDKKLRGVLGVDLRLTELSAFLANLNIGRHGKALIFDKQGRLIAYPEMDRMLKKVEGKLKPVMLNELNDRVLERAYNRFQIEGHGSRDLVVLNRRYLNTVSSLKSTVGRDWSIMIIVPEDDFVGFVRDNFRTILMMTAVIVVLASLLAGLLVFQGLRADRNASLLLDRKQALEAQSRAFSELASRATLFDPADSESLEQLTEIVSSAEAVRRVSIWRLVENGKALACDDCYDRESQGHTQGTLLEQADFPHLFEALKKPEEIIAADAGSDPRTSELQRLYLEPLGCRSLLGVPINHRGQTTGAVWFENEGKTGAWDTGDISFIRAVASMLALRFSADRSAEPIREVNAFSESTPSVDRTSSVKTADPGAMLPQPPAEKTPRDRRSASLAKRLLERGYDQKALAAEVFGDATVLVMRFTDVLSIAVKAGDDDPVPAIDHIVRHFEELIETHPIDYWKVMGDQIICAAGLGEDSNSHAGDIADVALSVQNRCAHLLAGLDKRLGFRIGIDTGAVVGSLVGKKRKTLNVWGEAVRAAQTMAENGVTGGIHVSEGAYRSLQKEYLFKVRGKFYLPEIGEISTYILTSRL